MTAPVVRRAGTLHGGVKPLDAAGDNRPRKSGRWIVWLLVPLGFLVFVGANAHLVYVAFESQPDCVAHSKVPGEAGRYSAAKSAC